MLDFLESDKDAHEIIRALCEDNPKLNWEYILIDEAQDWSERERNLILHLYDKDKVLVADGGQQFVRNITPCDWTVVSNRNNIKLKFCLRQKRNLVRFINHYSEMIDSTSTKVHPSDELVGGEIIIVKDSDKLFSTIKNEKNDLIKAGNEAYDMLFITPPSLVNSKDGNRSFKLLGEFERKNVLLWDGTNDDNRLEFSVDMSESRVVQYESSRGLEGWTVCCLNFDEYMQIKESQFDPNTEGKLRKLRHPLRSRKFKDFLD